MSAGTQPTIFINGRFLTQRVTGVQRYALELIGAMDRLLAESDGRAYPHIACLAPPGKMLSPGWQRIELRQVGLNHGNLWEQIDLPLHAGNSLLFSPANSGPLLHYNQVICLHDASVFAVPGSYSPLFRAKYRLTFRWLARHARSVLTDSSFSRQELEHHLHLDPARFNVIHPGCDHLDRLRPDPRVLEHHGLKRDTFLLIVASPAAHKNLRRAFEALRGLDKRLLVAVVGSGPSQVFQGTQLRPSDQVKLLGYVSDAELKCLYENALGLLYPSIYEGFGLPVLEAMRCGCPVLCADAAALPEVAGDAALYFDPYDVADMRAEIANLLNTPALQEELRLKGIARCAGFTWQAAARQILEILAE